jgi:hypothetical protein
MTRVIRFTASSLLGVLRIIFELDYRSLSFDMVADARRRRCLVIHDTWDEVPQIHQSLSRVI